MNSILGHQDVYVRFLNSMRKEQLHHAWLLHGPSGIGKATLGFAMARTYLCEKNQSVASAYEACGECHACHMMTAGSHPDFLQVDQQWDEKKKHLKRDVHIGQTRELLSFLSLSGSQSDKRVVLIDDVEKMNTQAANALLKGLEEPAAGSLLILACEDVMSIPVTVRSRCLLQALAPLDDDDCRQILCTMGVQDRMLDFAVHMAHGQPGKLTLLADAEIADALLDWHRLTEVLAKSDIGCLQDWIACYVRKIPHVLIADVVLDHLACNTQQDGGFYSFEKLMDAAWNLAMWPAQVARRTLNPASTLLAHMLSLRIALRTSENTSKVAA